MVDRNEAFVREVDEELRREQLQKLWEKYGVLVVALVGLLLAGIGGYSYMKSSRIQASEAAGARFQAATRLVADGKTDDALKALGAIATGSSKGYQTLAGLQLAGLQAKADKIADAVAAYDAVAKDQTNDPIFRDFAALQAAMLRVDAADWTEMENRLTPLMSEASAWRALARETLGLAAYKAGKSDEARKLFEQALSDRATPPSASERAQLMLSLLTDSEAAKSAATVPTPAATPVKGDAGKAGAQDKSGAPVNQKAPPPQKK